MNDTQHLLEDVRAFFNHRTDVAEQRSIGGSRTFTVAGNMCCGVGKKGLMVRVGPQRYPWALAQPHCSPLVMGSKHPLGYVHVDPLALENDGALAQWIDHALRFVLTLPPKHPGSPRPRSRS